MENRAKYVVPPNPKRIEHEEMRGRRKQNPGNISLNEIYEQNEIIIANQDYIIDLLTNRK